MTSAKLIVLLTGLGAAFITPSRAEEAAETPKPVARVAAWNVACGRNDKGGTPIPADRIQRIGKAIAEHIKPDVLVLEEVWPAEAAADIAKASTDAGFELKAVEVPPDFDTVVQRVSILARPGVEVSDVSLIEGTQDIVEGTSKEEQSTRRAVLAKVKIGKFDGYVIGVHLKSKREYEGETTLPIDMRDRQCAVIADKIKELTAGSEKDVLLLGDFNMTPAVAAAADEPADQKNFDTLNRDKNLVFISDEQPGYSHIGHKKGGALWLSRLDGFAISTGATKEYVPKSFELIPTSEFGLEPKDYADSRKKDVYISDHLPILAQFNTAEDDD